MDIVVYVFNVSHVKDNFLFFFGLDVVVLALLAHSQLNMVIIFNEILQS